MRVKVLTRDSLGLHGTGDNPGRRELVKFLLGKIVKDVEHHAAMPYSDTPAFMVELRKDNVLSACSLEFTILTCARTAETIEATWHEFDLDARDQRS